MLTIFTTLKPFRDPHVITIQKNALQSWLRLRPRPEIIILGNDEGVRAIASELVIRHIPTVKTTPNGLPFISSLFETAQKIARFPLLCMISGDIILMNDFLKAIKTITTGYNSFLALGRRWDLEIKKPIIFSEGWEKQLKRSAKEGGMLHGLSAMDYLIFPKNLFTKIPPFVAGRPGWDNWLVFNARSRNIPVIDITKEVLVIHQNHDIPGMRDRAVRFTDEYARKNVEYAGGYANFCTIRDANWILQKGRLKKNWFSHLSLWYPWRIALAVKRTIYQSLFQ